MKLEKIKLSGFKSFVDATTIPIHSNLTAIVGPNGCGKSNIIDAVRWVMGESSAKHLRGGAMTDVIFNGSSGRKPVSMASVELVFNNSEGKLGGEFAQYSQISIKRQVSRDGQSGYFLNGSRCRRKDITDLFLGTGLGSRSYAIIEQGTISRMVEAKPEDLRVHIEEAAGISKYKERRNETETRIAHTRENLERLNDVRDEVAKQVSSLQKQAQKAKQYKIFKQQERQLKAELLAIRWQNFQTTAQEIENRIQTVAVEHNRLFIKLRDLNASLETNRAAQKTQQQQLNHTQGNYYQTVADVNRLEQTIQHAKRSHEETRLEIQRANEHAAQALEQLHADKEILSEIGIELGTSEAQKAAFQEQLELLNFQQQALQQQRQQWQNEWENYRLDAAKIQTQQQTSQLKIAQIHHQQQQLQLRLEKLREEHAELLARDLNDEILDLTEQIAEVTEQREVITVKLETLQSQIQTHRGQIQLCHESLNTKRAKSHDMQGQIKSLEILQQHAMAKDNQVVNAWLEKYGLKQNARLAELITVETGWELAVETVLARELQAVAIENFAAITPFLDELSNESMVFFKTVKTNLVISSSKLPLLKNKIQSNWKLESLVAGIYCTETLENALNLLPQIQSHESIITQNGIWLGQGWLKATGRNDANHGILQREKTLRDLLKQHANLQLELTELETQLQSVTDLLKQTELQREDTQENYNELTAELSTKNGELSAQSTHLAHQEQRLQQIEEEQYDIYLTLTESNEILAEIEDSCEQADEHTKLLNQQNESLENRRQNLHFQQQQIEQAIQTVQQGLATQNAKIEGLTSSEQLLNKQLVRLELQHHQAITRITELKQKQSDNHAPIELEQEQLVEKTELRATLETQLKTVSEQLEKLEKEITSNLENQLLAQRDLDAQKEKLDALRFELQDCNVRQQTVVEQLNEYHIDSIHILKTLPKNANEADWKNKAQNLTEQIERLGTINLTAIDEHQIQDERLKFLTEQHDDLTQALETLTQAIDQINQESRLRFKATFDKINTGLQEKFPKLFGGGQAYLELTSNEILEAGVSIIARPPGKRNSSIHLLSGGEKALTAVALVFSIFELNPAPFCLLDEVDAPLDDANVERFSKMVETMSQSVQFLYISHNKVTMEIAKQLAGVTMKEPGVSRMVAVNIEDAVNLAEI